MTRLVIDASIWLPAFTGPDDSPPVRLFEALMDSTFQAVACPLLLDEVRRGLAKPYFRARLPTEDADRLMRALTRASVELRDPRSPPAVLRDPTDDYLVAIATTARAIVTGDKDLLDHQGLHPPALTARAACELLGLL
ncbi:putative toxin-antitoxin system toxin component, PIN family [Conexibacter woesei]|uniref:Nucleic acid-binding protein contains PIN domain-like protein n=1 Tax=Conexibacter woesei (strain DSM 14684 / CCUG 47730 / CIP 108061 / JCM 11494 / NBRC 100937 / ID131577) TaxID=469383 RepID=D3FE96_CONWI|nr:putative toxin-antitoxin system toxin component, PIN family [Conexibacter woesei]ADB53588.1 nucleic acid-binding protein contains PIN domain- like protein [Conexibacter woesei DSM 14684]